MRAESASMPKTFTARIAMLVLIAIGAALLLSPLAAAVVSAAGMRIRFARIFDRTAMAAVFIALVLRARELDLFTRLGRGFAHPAANARRALRGLELALLSLATLWCLIALVAPSGPVDFAQVGARLGPAVLSAIVIAIIEEGFFRALLLDGMRDDFGSGGALIASSVVYALAHILRAPPREYVVGLQPLAGVHSLMVTLPQLAEPAALLAFIGLFLIGLVLGRAFILTGTIYLSAGLHAGFVIGAKLWPLLVRQQASMPQWLIGFGRPPLIRGVAAWATGLALLALLGPLTRARRKSQSYTGGMPRGRVR